ncbi:MULTISPECIES: glycosyltransferase family 4 protein [unclassified Roseobacter]|uniref:glycosyltransferase family 4 protein n=1 Tax=unclassified Roseobacter TaxID=196798 RepID=UPI0030EB9C38
MPRDLIFLANDCFDAMGGIAHYNRNFCYIASRALRGSQLVFVSRSNKASRVDHNSGAIVKTINPKQKFLYTLHSLISAYRMKKKLVVVCGHMNLLPVAALMKLVSGCNIVLQIHGVEAWSPGNNIKKIIIKNYVDCVLSVSHVTATRFKAWSNYREPISIVSNCINVKEYREHIVLDETKISPIQNFAQGRKIIMFLGRLDERERYKGVDELISVFVNYPSLSQRACYIVCGGGSDLQRLKAKVHTLGLSETIKFTEFVDDWSKKDLLKICDAFVLAGFGEGFGITLLEAIASGAPVVASSLDGTHEAILEGELGIAVDPSDTDALHGALMKCFASGRHNNDKIMHFDIDRSKDRYAALFIKIFQ